MLKTESEAEQCWCPMARVALDAEGLASGNRFHGEFSFEWPHTGGLCVSSDCMAWRWARTATKRGYCGLAGTCHG